MSKNIRRSLLLILLLSVASLRRKLLKTTHAAAEALTASIQIQKVATFKLDRKKLI